MQAYWQPHPGIEMMFAQIKEGGPFAIFTQKLMDKHTMVDSFLIVINKTGQYQTHYEEWMQLQATQNSWQHNTI